MDIASRFRTTATPSLDQLRAGQSSVVRPITDSPRSLVDRIREQQSFFSTVGALPNDQQIAAIDAFRQSGVNLFPRAELPSFVQRRPVTSNIENIVEVTERDDPIEELETQAIKEAAPSFVRVAKGSADRDRSDDFSSPLSSTMSEGEKALLGQVQKQQKTLNQVDAAFEKAEGRGPKNIFEGAFDFLVPARTDEDREKGTGRKEDYDPTKIGTIPGIDVDITTRTFEGLSESAATGFLAGLAGTVDNFLGPLAVKGGIALLKGGDAETVGKNVLEAGATTALSLTPLGPGAGVAVAAIKTGAEIADSEFEGFGFTNFMAGMFGNLTGEAIGTKIEKQTQEQATFESQIEEAFMGIGSPDETAPEPEESIFIRDHKDDWGLTAPEDLTTIPEIQAQIDSLRAQEEAKRFLLEGRVGVPAAPVSPPIPPERPTINVPIKDPDDYLKVDVENIGYFPLDHFEKRGDAFDFGTEYDRAEGFAEGFESAFYGEGDSDVLFGGSGTDSLRREQADNLRREQERQAQRREAALDRQETAREEARQRAADAARAASFAARARAMQGMQGRSLQGGFVYTVNGSTMVLSQGQAKKLSDEGFSVSKSLRQSNTAKRNAAQNAKANAAGVGYRISSTGRQVGRGYSGSGYAMGRPGDTKNRGATPP